MTKTIGYWLTTSLIALSMLSGGIAQILHLPENVDGTVHILGYPAYVLTILGFWKILGAMAILAPRFPRLKEWAYAGIVFDLTGAAASHLAAHDYGAYGFHVVVTLFLTALTMVSWALRPASRVILPLVSRTSIWLDKPPSSETAPPGLTPAACANP